MIVLNDMKKLSAIHGPCLTIYQPLRDAFSQVTKADTRLNAAAHRADELLIAKGFDAEARARFLRPIFKIARNTDWTARNGSIVIFRAPGFTKAGFWPDILEPDVAVSDEFVVLPLLPGFNAKRTFWVLALSIKNVRLFRGSADGLSEVDLPASLPRNLSDAESFATPDHDLAGQSAPGGSNGQMGSVHFGTSSLHNKQAAYLRDFFRMVNRAIASRLARSGDPLVLAAVPRELAIYRDLNTYPELVAEAIHGSPDSFVAHQLFERARAIIAAGQASPDLKSRKELDVAAGRGLLLTEAIAIRNAARFGQVERLFVDTRSAADKDLINSAALAVFRTSGKVVCGELPNGEASAAVLRYRIPKAEPILATSHIG
jgi:hypothetical protein